MKLLDKIFNLCVLQLASILWLVMTIFIINCYFKINIKYVYLFFSISFFKLLFEIYYIASKGFWGEILGVGDFYYELAVQIIQVCYLSRSKNGGLIEINELKKTLTEIRGKNAVKISV